MTLGRKAFVSAAVAATFLGALGAATPMASAQPSTDFIDPDNRCFYDLTPPSLVELPGGAKAVSASLVTTRCTGKAAPTNVVVCVETPQSPGQCGSELNWEEARVFVTAPEFSGPFTAKSVGCWRDLLAEFGEKCQPSGPLTVTF